MKTILIYFSFLFTTSVMCQTQDFYISSTDIFTYTKLYKLNLETCETELLCTVNDHVGVFLYHPDGTLYFISNRHKAEAVPKDTADIFIFDIPTCSLRPTFLYFEKSSGTMPFKINEKGSLLYKFQDQYYTVDLKTGLYELSTTQYVNWPFVYANKTYYYKILNNDFDQLLYKYNITSDTFEYQYNFGSAYNNQISTGVSITKYTNQCFQQSALILKGDNFINPKYSIIEYNFIDKTLKTVCPQIPIVEKNSILFSPTEYLSHITECDLLIDLDSDNSSGAYPYDFRPNKSCGNISTHISDTDLYIHSNHSEDQSLPAIDSIKLVLSNIQNGLFEKLAYINPFTNISFYQLDDSTYIIKALVDKSDSSYAKALSSIVYTNGAANIVSGTRTIKVKGYNALLQSEYVHCYIDVGQLPNSGQDSTFTFCEALLIDGVSNTIKGGSNGMWQPSFSTPNVYNSQYDTNTEYKYITSDEFCGVDTAIIFFQKNAMLQSTRDTVTCSNAPIIYDGKEYVVGDTLLYFKPNLNACDSLIHLVYQPRVFVPIAINIDPNTVCPNEQTSVSISNVKDVQWADQNTSNSRLLTSGEYALSFTYINGCKDSTQFSIKEYPQASFNITKTASFCNKNNGSISISPSDNIISIDINGSITTSADIFNLEPDAYAITILDTNNCTTYLTEISIDENQGEHPNFIEELHLEKGESVLLPLTGHHIIQNIDASIDPFGITVVDSSTVEILGTISQDVAFQFLDQFGCIHEVLLHIFVADNFNLVIPNVFSPSSSNSENKSWHIDLPPYYNLISCSVMDRWGNLVYYSNDQVAWNGTANGKTCNQGVYIYLIKYQLDDGHTKSLMGDITIID